MNSILLTTDEHYELDSPESSPANHIKNYAQNLQNIYKHWWDQYAFLFQIIFYNCNIFISLLRQEMMHLPPSF